jgi:alpha-ketoglutarate-dependent taurine dioxygenase
VDPGTRADPEKKALFAAATKVIHLTKHIGTELVGLQLKDLTDQQKDELGLLIAERSVVFFRDQELNPRQQLELGEYYGEIEVHPQAPRVPGLDGITVIWPEYKEAESGRKSHFRKPGGSSVWHTDLVHEKYPAGVTHLHNVPCQILNQL